LNEEGLEMKKMIVLLLSVMLLFTSTACGTQQTEPINPEPKMEPKIAQMKSICELAVMECYYHNVAKFKEEDAEGILFWKKDKHFWIEYSGIVKLGIDASLVSMNINGNQISITIPEAKVLGCKVDSASLNADSYIVDSDSAAISAEDEVKAFDDAQNQLMQSASNDKTLLAGAQQQAQTLLEGYITNIGNAIGKEYSIQWVYLDAEGNPLGSTVSSSNHQEGSSSTSSNSSN